MPQIRVPKLGDTGKDRDKHEDQYGACLPWRKDTADINSLLFGILEITTAGVCIHDVHEPLMRTDEYREWRPINANQLEAY